jgi:dTMP kinase
MKRGKLMVLEGGDGAGKSSQCKLIKEYLTNIGLSNTQFHFPTYTHNEFGKVITSFLQGNFGKSDEVNPYFVANIYAMDRFLFKSELIRMMEEFDVVLLDRYVYSNMAFQGAKFATGSEENLKIIEWIKKLEFEFLDLPKFDLCVYLKVPQSIIKERLNAERTGDDRAYLNGGKDIHEEDMNLQQRVEENYLSFSDLNYHIVDCGDKLPVPIFQSYFKLINGATRDITHEG